MRDRQRAAITSDQRVAEAGAVRRLLALQPDAGRSREIGARAQALAERVRAARPPALSAESFLRNYGLSTRGSRQGTTTTLRRPGSPSAISRTRSSESCSSPL